MSIGKGSEHMSQMVVYIVLVCSCGEEKAISGDVCGWLYCIRRLIGWLVLFKIVSSCNCSIMEEPLRSVFWGLNHAGWWAFKLLQIMRFGRSVR